MTSPAFDQFQHSLEADDRDGAARWLDLNPGILAALGPNDCGHGIGLLGAVHSVGMVELLLRHGLDVTRVNEWWTTGFGLNRLAPEVAEHLITRGARVTPHAAAALGLTGRLRALLDEQPGLVHARGGDGGRPLHFSRDVETAHLLVGRGAELEARDDDHDSTAAQWRIGDAPEVTRFLLAQGARPDLFMAAGLGDLALARKLVADDPACTTLRIGNNRGPFPGVGFRQKGGTIYQWTLGFNQSPQEIAHHRRHHELFGFLMSHTPPRQRLLVACMLADRSLAGQITAQFPGVLRELDDEDHTLLAKCCWETNLNPAAVRLMLDLGFPVDAPEFNHGYQPLHNAAWCGNPELVELLLQRGHPVGGRDPGYHSTPLGFAIHSCATAKRHPEGDFPRVVRLLLEAGTPLDDGMYPSGNEGIDSVIKRHRDTSRWTTSTRPSGKWRETRSHPDPRAADGGAAARRQHATLGAPVATQPLFQDLRYGVRILAKQPGFKSVAVLTLALGLAVNATILGMIEAFFFEHCPGIEAIALFTPRNW